MAEDLEPRTAAENRRALVHQLGLLLFVAVVYLALTRGGGKRSFGLDPLGILVLMPLVVAVLAPLGSAWNRRLSVERALGLPLLSLLACHAVVWTVILLAMRNPICRGPHSGCDGLAIFLAMSPIYAGVTAAVSALWSGTLRGVAGLFVRRPASTTAS